MLLLWVLTVLCAPPAAANAGIGAIESFLPAALLLLVIVVPLEAWMAERLLGLDHEQALSVSIFANLASTLLGIPLGWWWATGDLEVYAAAVWEFKRYIGVPIGEAGDTWSALAGATFLLVPSFFISVACEYFVARLSLGPHPRRRLGRWAWSANALSYVLLFAFLSPLFYSEARSGVRDKARAQVCRSSLLQMGIAILQYRKTHGDRMPPAADFASLARVIEPELVRAVGRAHLEGDLRCPATRKAYQFNAALSGMSGASIAKPDETPMVRDAQPHRNGSVRVLFADGQVKSFSAPHLVPGLGRFR